MAAAERNTKFVCIDETQLSYSDGRFRAWQSKDAPNTHGCEPVWPRVSIILALSSLGDLYLSILQGNSNSDLMRLFVSSLAERMDGEDKAWRDKTIWIWDG